MIHISKIYYDFLKFRVWLYMPCWSGGKGIKIRSGNYDFEKRGGGPKYRIRLQPIHKSKLIDLHHSVLVNLLLKFKNILWVILKQFWNFVMKGGCGFPSLDSCSVSDNWYHSWQSRHSGVVWKMHKLHPCSQLLRDQIFICLELKPCIWHLECLFLFWSLKS